MNRLPHFLEDLFDSTGCPELCWTAYGAVILLLWMLGSSILEAM